MGEAPNSRRVTASAVHIRGAAAGAPPSEPDCSHENSLAPRPLTEPDAAARGAVITGATAAAGADDTAGATETESAAAAGDTRSDGEELPTTGVAAEIARPTERATLAGRDDAAGSATAVLTSPELSDAGADAGLARSGAES